MGEADLFSRFITKDRWLREDRTIKADAFIPPSDLNLSITRHGNLSLEALWAIGDRVYHQINPQSATSLKARADISELHIRTTQLGLIAHPIIGNDNHFHIVDWPDKKEDRKDLALKLAAHAGKAVFRA